MTDVLAAAEDVVHAARKIGRETGPFDAYAIPVGLVDALSAAIENETSHICERCGDPISRVWVHDNPEQNGHEIIHSCDDPQPHVHEQRFDGDDPYLICGCGARWDALSGAPLNGAAR
jgi:hypothetical protein